MPSWQEALAAIEGLKRLLRFDPGFAQWFDRSATGAKRSFGLMLPLLPCFLIRFFVGADLRPELDPLHVFGAAAVAYVLSWVMFPLLLIVIGRAIERENQAIGAITFYNWFGAAFTLVLTALHLIASAGIFSESLLVLTNILVLASLVFEAFALRVVMGIGYGGAILLTVLDFILNWSLSVLLLMPLYQPIAT
ncbi:hypothetical protein [Dongia sp.]|uniref:hypothetical protein n=1 Tax=Dongia sp. TaxID=1977262 RepID=UPI0035B4038A